MKKLLVLVMVLGLAATANATLSIQLDGGAVPAVVAAGTHTISIVSSTATPWSGYLELESSEGAYAYDNTVGDWVGAIAATVHAGCSATENGPTNSGYFGVWQITSAGVPVPGPLTTAGTQWNVTYDAYKTGTMGITLYSDDWATVDTAVSFTQTPEPITIGLLGLGGLFLRRRK
jgi:hypothetical protein